ncbi:MAG TPA: guanylate kinase [Pseudobdellovibrionaceae bacterium]|nr:guanylate kinase [Pseudobdellovibrionaceae bacterium]
MKTSENKSIRMIIVAAPSGAGKSTFLNRIMAEEPRLYDTVTYTTRKMRDGESQGNPYFFVTQDEFERKVNDNYFVEWARVHNNLYGTPMNQLEQAWKNGKCVIMDVDVQGAKTFKSKFPDAVSVFILPPSIEALRQRILKRNNGKVDDLEVRMKSAEYEMTQTEFFDFQLINDNFEESYLKFKNLIVEILK